MPLLLSAEKPLNQYLARAFRAFILLGTLTVVCWFYVESTKNSSDTVIHIVSQRTRSPFNSRLQSNQVNNKVQKGQKIVFAFGYWEQLTMATNNLLQLAAFAAYGGCQVVVPFSHDSHFYGTPPSEGSKTLALYYNVTALNYTLRLHGHATLIIWQGFQDVCKGRLDVLVYFDHTNLKTTTTYSHATPFIACKPRLKGIIKGIKIRRRVCMNVFALDSIERFESEVVKGLPCVGILERRGTLKAVPFRAQFNLTSVVSNLLSSPDISGALKSKLLYTAQRFISQNLGLFFIAVHIRTGRILKNEKNFHGKELSKAKSVSKLKKCTSKLRSQVDTILHSIAVPCPVYPATDFTEFGSTAGIAKHARDSAKSLLKILAPLKPITFQPSEHNLTDRGAVAIVEMNILASGKHLVALGGGSFQHWITVRFLKKNGNDQTKVEPPVACKPGIEEAMI